MELRGNVIYTAPITRIPYGDAPSLLNKSYTITAEVEIPEQGAEGIIAKQGSRFAGVEPLFPGKHTLNLLLSIKE